MKHHAPAQTMQDHTATVPSPANLLERAASESAESMPNALQHRMQARFGHDFGHVRIHAGPASAAAAEALGARAYTVGRDVHLGREVPALPPDERQQLLAHEAIHTAQQGAGEVHPSDALSVSHPDDAAEREAHTLAEHLGHRPSPSLALRDRVLGPSSPARIQRSVAPHIQRDLKGKHTVKDGHFDVNLKTESHPGAKNGMSGTIEFTASDKAPDSKNIRLLQVVRDQNLETGKEYQWTGDEADRNKMMTKATKGSGFRSGFFVDHSAALANPRTLKADPAVSPYYRDYWPNAASSQDGSKQGKTVKEASLWDYPGSSGKRRFTFETAAKGADTGYIFATLRWGFTISDPAKGKVTNEHAKAYRGPSRTFVRAVSAFDEFYKNPGASTAPTK
ncbi:MAG: DUF4157 domain-containing protein [Thauera propionica]|jgi:hypothetical protein|nr:DUF4157 domain-containing protein [Thauera propionica]